MGAVTVRKPQKPFTVEQRKARKNASPAVLNREDIINRVAKGERLIDIAKSYGLTNHASISVRFSGDEEYLQARIHALEARLETRESELERAKTSATIARARELLSHARWRAEREHPERWGQRTHVQVERVGDLGERLRRARERVINPLNSAQDTVSSVRALHNAEQSVEPQLDQ